MSLTGSLPSYLSLYYSVSLSPNFSSLSQIICSFIIFSFSLFFLFLSPSPLLLSIPFLFLFLVTRYQSSWPLINCPFEARASNSRPWLVRSICIKVSTYFTFSSYKFNILKLCMIIFKTPNLLSIFVFQFLFYFSLQCSISFFVFCFIIRLFL